MSDNRKKLPGVLLLLLSTLGFLFGLGAALLTLVGAAMVGGSLGETEILPLYSSGMLSLLVALLNMPAFYLAIRYIKGKTFQTGVSSLFKAASLSLILWIGVLAGGYFAVQPPGAPLLAALLTVAAVIIPIWWLVEFGRRKLPRSNAAREWGTLAVGLTASPFIIMVIETTFLLVVGVGVFIALSAEPDAMRQIGEIFKNIEDYQGSLEQVERLIYDLAQNPAVAAGLFMVIGVLAPFVEELFKPMAVWFLLNRPLKESEGFSLGLISGGAFALLESAGLVGQIGGDTWLPAVVLRAGTGLLHIGLSGLVGYGLVRSLNRKAFAGSLLYLLAAGALHSAWNSMALLSGLATSPIQVQTEEFQQSIQSILPIIGMVAVFIAVLAIVLRINRDLRRAMQEKAEENSNPPEA